MNGEIPKVQGTKQQYRIWFEYYKIAKFKGTKEQRANLKSLDKKTGFYREWEPINDDTKFDEWWKEKNHLFGDTRVKEISRVASNPLALNISIPLTETASKAVREVKDLIDQKQAEWWKTVGRTANPARLKNRAIPAKYPITGEIKGADQHSIQLVFKLWVDLNRPAVTDDFLDHVEKWFRSRPKSKWLPRNLQPKVEDDAWDERTMGKTPDDQNARKSLKNQGINTNLYATHDDYFFSEKSYYSWTSDTKKVVRRQLKTADAICTAVSKGRFPK